MTPEFLAAVKAGRFPFLVYETATAKRKEVIGFEGQVIWMAEPITPDHWMICTGTGALLSYYLRDWFTAKGWKWNLSEWQLSIGSGGPLRTIPKHFKDGSPLDWHISAALHVLACEEGQG